MAKCDEVGCTYKPGVVLDYDDTGEHIGMFCNLHGFLKLNAISLNRPLRRVFCIPVGDNDFR